MAHKEKIFNTTESAVKIVYIALIFLAGFILSQLINIYSIPVSYYLAGYSINAPSNFFEGNDIQVYEDRVILLVDNPGLRSYNTTGSMLPFLGENANGIVVKPISSKDVNVGDIVTFNRSDTLIVHRVVEKGVDDQGVYFITKGDNSDFSDGKIRFEQIEHVIVAIVY